MLVSAVSMNSKVASTSPQKSKQSGQNSISNLSNDTFQKSEVSFKAKKFPSGIYCDSIVEQAKKYMSGTGNNWREEIVQKMVGEYKDSAGVLDDENIRPIFAVLTLGLSEITNFVTRKISAVWDEDVFNRFARENLRNIENLIIDLKAGHKGIDVPN